MRDFDRLVSNYITIAIQYGEALQEGNSIIVNRNYAKMKRIFFALQKQGPEIGDTLLKLLGNDSYHVQLWAAVHSLSLSLNIPEAESKLSVLAKRTDIGVNRLDAEILLQTWREKKKLVL